MFSGSVVDTKSDILVLEVEASGCGVLTVRKKSEIQSQIIVSIFLLHFFADSNTLHL